MRSSQLAFIGGALALHVGAWIVMGAMPRPHKQSSVAIALAEAKKKSDEKKKPPVAPPAPAPERPAARTRNPSPSPKAAQPEAAPQVPAPNAPPPPAGDAPAAMDGFADLGLALSGGGGGMSVPSGGGSGAQGPHLAAPVATTRQVKQLAASDPGCTEDMVKPKLEHQVQPAYTAEAQQASVEGKVRLEVTIDASGHVTSVRVLSGLGFGLDEAALAAVKQYTFAAATKCGRAVPTTIKMGVSFGLK